MSFEDEHQEWMDEARRTAKRRRLAIDDDDTHGPDAETLRESRQHTSSWRGIVLKDGSDDEPNLSPDGNTLPDKHFRR